MGYLIPGCDGVQAWTGSGVSVLLLLLLLSCRRCLKNHQKCKTEIDDQSHLERHFGIVKHGILHSFPLRIFLKNTKHCIVWKSDLSSEKFVGFGTNVQNWGLKNVEKS